MTQTSSSWPSVWRLPPLAWLGVAAAAGVTAGLVVDKASSPLLLLVLAAGGVAAAVILAVPEIGLLALVVTTYTSLSNVLIQFHGAPSIAKVLAPLVLLSILLRWVRTGTRPEGWLQASLLVSLYAFACTLSLFAARAPAFTFAELTLLAKNALIVLCVVTLVQSGATLRRVIWALLAATIFMGTLSVHQQLTGNFEFDYWGFGRTPVGFALEGEHTTRLGGPIGDPNFYGMLLLTIVPLAIDRLQFEKRPLLRLAALWALGASMLTIVFTYSRSALVSLVALLGLVAVVRRPKPLHLLAAAAVVAALVPLAPDAYIDRVTQLADSVTELSERGTTREMSVRGRLSENLVAIEMFQDHPIVGVGLGNYPFRYDSYSREVGLDPRIRRKPHNLYLEILSETGLIGMAAFGLLIWSALGGALEARKALFAAGKNDIARITEAFTLSFIGFLIASVFLHASHPRYFWLLAGIALALGQVGRNETAAEPREPASGETTRPSEPTPTTRA